MPGINLGSRQLVPKSNCRETQEGSKGTCSELRGLFTHHEGKSCSPHEQMTKRPTEEDGLRPLIGMRMGMMLVDLKENVVFQQEIIRSSLWYYLTVYDLEQYIITLSSFHFFLSNIYSHNTFIML